MKGADTQDAGIVTKINPVRVLQPFRFILRSVERPQAGKQNEAKIATAEGRYDAGSFCAVAFDVHELRIYTIGLS